MKQIDGVSSMYYYECKYRTFEVTVIQNCWRRNDIRSYAYAEGERLGKGKETERIYLLGGSDIHETIEIAIGAIKGLIDEHIKEYGYPSKPKRLPNKQRPPRSVKKADIRSLAVNREALYQLSKQLDN